MRAERFRNLAIAQWRRLRFEIYNVTLTRNVTSIPNLSCEMNKETGNSLRLKTGNFDLTFALKVLIRR